ncbi:putative glycosyltransferase [Owenweeksia hongkongensis DSM 17368]|uniref:Putative glycosyltransferase n=1 Tax=Owenweeksia hongkongensis (strain DSM 17368 / CIP 108786 / JCM 12287 / NRRL B-23963 / UST20020801) TaxID=926562 RepID=G8R4L1_OWEHD|nr:glycosyltransferase family 2 protein [Owenweeksia hongkongensis]AEV32100.1 putative glycosyltransferase [Owenweeksia hongkongensis DSM 17368]
MPETKPQHKIAVAILNWNGAALLRRFLPSVIEHSQAVAQVYVIDNASSDESLEVLKTEFPQVKLIVLNENYGYAGGYNKGLDYIKEDYVVLLNSDVEVTANWLPPLLSQFENNPKLAALQPKIKDLNKKDHFEYAGAAGGHIDILGYPFCRGRLFDTLEEDKGQYDSYQKVFWASGACLVVDSKKYREAGGLNESLFAHMEEIDLCWRMQLQGFEVGCEPASTVYHLGGGTLNKLSSKKTYLNFRNSLIIMFLNLPSGEAFAKIMARLVLDGIAGIKFIFEGKFVHTLAILKAHFHFYVRFNDMMRQKVGKPVKPLNKLEGVYHGSVVQQHYLSKKKKYSEL